jgi:hypothetical protein
MTLTQSESELLKTAINSARQRQALEDKLRRERLLLQQKRAENKEPYLRKLREHSLKSAGINVEDFVKSQARDLELADASWTEYKADSAELSRMIHAQQQAEIERRLSDLAVTGKFRKGPSPELTHVGPIILDTADDILASTWGSPPTAQPQTGHSPKHNFMKASLGLSSDAWVVASAAPYKSVTADYYFLWTPDQDGFLGTSAQVFYNGAYFIYNSETWGDGYGESGVNLYVMYAAPWLMAPIFQARAEAFAFEASGGQPLLGSVVRGNYNGSVTVSSDRTEFFRVFANYPIFIDVQVGLFVLIDSPAGAYLDFSSDMFEINVPAVSLDLYV